MDFTPRLTDSGMSGNAWWYSSGNVFYASGYGLPNCTCYAYGRYAEIRGEFALLPTGDGGKWYPAATAFSRGNSPALGAVACWASKSGNYAGHVAIVEVINSDGSIITSNSAYNGTYFWTETLTKESGYVANWMKTNRDYYLQGFIYNDGGQKPLPEAKWQAKNTGAYGRESDEAFQNAIMTYSTLSAEGWSINAICALLGNLEYESGYNPWRWEGDIVLATTDQILIAASMVHGYGLVQFTPAGKYIYAYNAMIDPEYSPHFSDATGLPEDGASQLRYINTNADYYPTSTFPISYDEFKTSDASPDELATVWLYNYERPADPEATNAGRREAALYWADILSEFAPFPPYKKKKKRMPLWMMLNPYF